MKSFEEQLEIDSRVIGSVFGLLDINIKRIETAFCVKIFNRFNKVVIKSLSDTVSRDELTKARFVLKKLEEYAKNDEDITLQTVDYLILSTEKGEQLPINNKVFMTFSGRMLKAKTIGQKRYVDSITGNLITFGLGPAGTGKTYLAMAMAVKCLKQGECSRVILTRPAIEAGEKLGFLPGDLQQKVDPYLRPLYDALYDIMGVNNFTKNAEKGAIEVAPLAYMRGRTLDNAFIVLDEAQNCTEEQMKMFLTRLGFGSKMVITGDITQIDLPRGVNSGLKKAVDIVKDIDSIGICELDYTDVIRHSIVQEIIIAYDEKEMFKK